MTISSSNGTPPSSTIRAPAADAATDVAPKMTYAQVDSRMRAAQTVDALADAGVSIANRGAQH